MLTKHPYGLSDGVTSLLVGKYLTVFEYLISIPGSEYRKLWEMLDASESLDAGESASTVYNWLREHNVPASICAELDWDMLSEWWCINYDGSRLHDGLDQPIYDFIESALEVSANSKLRYEEWGVNELQEYLDSKIEVISGNEKMKQVKIGDTVFNVDCNGKYFINTSPTSDDHPIPEEGPWSDIGCTPRALSKRRAVRYVYGDDPFKNNPFYK